MITYSALALLVGVIVWRVVLPSMKLESDKTVTTETRTTPATTSSTPPRKGVRERATEHLWSILIVIVGVLAVYWGFQNTQIRPADAGKLSWTHWLSLLIIWGTLYVLIALNRKALGDVAKALQTVLVLAMVGALVVLPLVHAIWGEKSPSQQVQQLARPVVTMPANGDSVHVDQKVGYILIFTGSGFEHHVVYTGGRDCIVGNTKDPCQEGPILYQYVRDTTGKPNSATYRFVL